MYVLRTNYNRLISVDSTYHDSIDDRKFLNYPHLPFGPALWLTFSSSNRPGLEQISTSTFKFSGLQKRANNKVLNAWTIIQGGSNVLQTYRKS